MTRARDASSPPSPVTRWVPWGLVVLAMAFNLAAYHGEVTVQAPDSNDHVLHFAMVARANAVWDAGGNPRDPWIPYWGQGFPLLRYYQHLPHLTVVLIYRLLRGAVPLHDVFDAFHLAMLVAIPPAFFLGARLLGCSPITAALVALCAPLLSADPAQRYLFGLQPTTFTWIGPGLFPQLVGTVLFAPAVGALCRSALQGGRFGPALALLAGTWLSHLLLGYIACVLGLLVLLHPRATGQRPAVLLRLAALYLATLAVSLYLLAPTMLESHLLNRSVWEGAEYWDSLGMTRVLETLVTGGLLDGPRLPMLTLLAGVGLVLCITPTAERDADRSVSRFAAAAFVLSLLVYFGRPTWGAALTLLPFSDLLPLHRWVCAVQYAAVLLAGLALARLWHAMRWTSSPARAGAALMATLLLLSPAVAAQWRRAAEAATVQAVAAEEYTRHGQGLRELLQEVHRRDLSDPGRAYAGTSWDWGKDYRLAGLPMYLYWGEADISAISYMFHSASLNSELEVEFDRTRKASYDLFNIRYMFTYNPSFLPPFAQTFATRPGVHAARIDTPGYFDFVGADLFLSGRRATRRELYEFNRRFVRGPLHAQGRFVRIGFGAHDGPLPGEREITSTDALSPDEAWRAPRGAIVASWGHNDHFGATVRAEEPGYVLFRMTYHPGWRATVDGRPADTVMLSPSFLGIPVTPGAHQIEVRYRPGAWTTVLFYAGLAVLGLVFLGDRARIWPGCDRAGQPGGVRLLAEAALAVALLIALIAVSNVPVDHGAARASHLHTTGAFGHPATACQRAAPRASGRTVQPGPVLAPWHAHRRSAPIGLPSSVFAFDSIG